jgi:hypothetical protein
MAFLLQAGRSRATYVWTSFVGLLPGSALYVFVGRGLSNVSDFINGKVANPMSMYFSIAGIIVSVVMFVFLARYANRMVMEEKNAEHKKEGVGSGLIVESINSNRSSSSRAGC